MDIVNLARVDEIPQEELVRAINVLKGELGQRALEESLVKIKETTNKVSYNPNLQITPYIEDGLLYCPGIKTSRSSLAHKCTFVSIGNKWCWENDNKLKDEMIFTQNELGKTVNSLTILPLEEGTILDVVHCKASGVEHKVINVQTYEIIDNVLVVVKSRKINFSTHR